MGTESTHTPVIILEGVLGAGKTHTLQLLKDCFKNYKILWLEERDFTHQYLNNKLYNPLDEIYNNNNNNNTLHRKGESLICTQMIIHELELEKVRKTLTVNHDYDMIVMDRWDLSCKYFIELHHIQGKIGEYARDFLLEHVHSNHLSVTEKEPPSNDYTIVFLDVPIETSVERILLRGRPEEIKTPPNDWFTYNSLLANIIRKNQRSIKEDYKNHEVTILHSPEEITALVRNKLQPCSLSATRSPY